MASIEKRPNGRYKAYFQPPTGKRVTKTFDTKGEARIWITVQETAVLSGNWVAPERAKIGLLDWIDNCRNNDRNIGRATVRTEQRAVNRIMASPLADHTLASLDRETVDAWLTAELRAGYAPTTVKRNLVLLRKWLNRAVEMDRIPKNVANGLKVEVSKRKQMRALTMDQLVLLSEHISPRYATWVMFMGITGLRFSETNGLRRHHVDLDAGTVTVECQLWWDQDAKVWVDDGDLKTEGSYRTIPLGETLVEQLAVHLDEYSLGLKDGPFPNLVFPNARGNPLKSGTFTSGNFKPALRRAGLAESTRIHDLRHTAASLLINGGAPALLVQQRLGHSSIKVTMDIYGHLFNDVDEAAAKALDEQMRRAQQARTTPRVVPIERKRKAS